MGSRLRGNDDCGGLLVVGCGFLVGELGFFRRLFRVRAVLPAGYRFWLVRESWLVREARSYPAIRSGEMLWVTPSSSTTTGPSPSKA